MDDDRIRERERHQIEQIRQLDDEELQVEEVDNLEDDRMQVVMGDDRILERERLHIEQIRQLDLEELQVEEVDDLRDSSDEDANGRTGHARPASYDDFTFDTCITSLHTYLGEVEDTHHRTAFLDGGARLSLPLFYLEGISFLFYG